MLAPANRRLLLDALAPPEGYRLDHAIGTTYTLDLLALLRVPLAATALPWARPDGEPLDNPFALLTAVRQNAKRVSLFCHAGAIKVPARLQPLLTFLEGSVHAVTPPANGVFHPKCWFLRFESEEGKPLLRLVVLSRNLTFDRSWDVALVLEAEVGGRRHAANRPLEQLLQALPTMATEAGTQLDSATWARLEQVADEVRRANWQLPEAFQGKPVFRVPGLSAPEEHPLGGFLRLLITSPFVSADAVEQLRAVTRGEVLLVSRSEELAKVPPESLERVDEVFAFDDEQHRIETSTDGGTPAEVPDDDTTDLQGLHAKVFVGEANRRAYVFVGSANATQAGWGGDNVELVVELEGSRATHGIDAVLGGLKDAQLIRPFNPVPVAPEDPRALSRRKLEQIAHELSCGAVRASVVEEGDGRYRVDLCIQAPGAGAEAVRLEARPLSEHLWRRVDLRAEPAVSFPPVSAHQLTAFTALRLSQTVDDEDVSVEFVTRVPLEGAPMGRAEAVTAELLSDRDRLLRFLLLLLAQTPGDSDALLDDLAAAAESNGAAAAVADGAVAMPLLEPLLRTLHRDPGRLDEVARLIADIRQYGRPDALPPELDDLWQAVAAVRRA